MTIAVELAPDVLSRVESESRRTGKSVSTLADAALRAAYPIPADAETARKPFKVVPFSGTSLPAAWTSGCIGELEDMLDESHS